MKKYLGFTVTEWISIVILFAVVVKVSMYIIDNGKR
ncbi:hypothetical protein PMI10_00632 [Flavobacterium sp. CF136]|nr:hypothetical protein PMI10_00632 [Flavobacterium sp. CF136]